MNARVELTGEGPKRRSGTAIARVRASRAPVQKHRGITPKMRETFLERLGQGFSVTAAAQPTGKSRRRYYALREVDDEFAKAWDDAWEAGQDWIEDELRRAAIQGWDEEVFEGGELVRRIRRRDPRLLARLERKRQPEAVATGPTTLLVLSAFPGVRRGGDVIELEAEELPALEQGGEE